jgi:hypothetical protein
MEDKYSWKGIRLGGSVTKGNMKISDQHLKEKTRSSVEDPRRLLRSPRHQEGDAGMKRCEEKSSLYMHRALE